ncbi:IS1634 family transposase [uncultured Parasutterella sp.]|jgi:transposase|uniref:IS1634 family transposase n=1 Tax=uncultured Parasutterella sp. TaxID=1263098 RepID=UPI0025FF4C0C|nr:IS1634 family transposase [uncultured Parasutterella sp.]
MYLVIRGDRLYEGYSIVYTTKSGKKSTKGCIGKALGSKSELLAKDPLALEKLRAELKKRSAPNQATERTKQLLEEIPKKRPSLAYAGEPVLCYANYILKPIWNETLKLKALVRYQQSKTDIEFDAEALLWQTVVNRIVPPSSHLKHYRSQTNWLGNSLAETNLRSLYRMLSFAARIKKPILRGLNKALNQAMPRDLSVVFYDVTNTWFETVWDDEHQWAMEVEKQLSAHPSGAASEERRQLIEKLERARTSSLRMRGPSKECRKDPIVSIAMVVDRDGIPIDFRVYPGNSSEKTTMKCSIDELAKTYKITNVVVVADNGLNTNANLIRLVKENQGFLLAHSLSKAKQGSADEWLEDTGWQWDKEKERKIKIIPSSLVDEDGVVQTNYRMVIGWSEKRYREDMFKIEMHEQGAREAIAHHAKLPPATFGWKKYIETGKNKAQKINEKKLAKDKKLAGYYAYLFKDSREFDKEWVKLPAEEKKELSGWEIIEQYKKQAQIEECFRIMKTNFNLRPMYVYTDEHIEAQVLICVLALILLRILSKKLKLAGNPMTTEQILAALNTAKLSVQPDKEQPALYRPLRQILRRPQDDDPHAPIHLYEETDLSRIMNCVDLTPLPPVADKNELAHCLKTRFDTDKEALGAVYQI